MQPHCWCPPSPLFSMEVCPAWRPHQQAGRRKNQKTDKRSRMQERRRRGGKGRKGDKLKLVPRPCCSILKEKVVQSVDNLKPTPCLLPPASPRLQQHTLEMTLVMTQKMFKEHNISTEAWNTVGTNQARLNPIAQGCQDGKPINIWQ